MIGKFWTGEEGVSRSGRPLPRTPVTFLSIRSAVRTRDPALLRRAPEFASRIAVAVDDGRDVLMNRSGRPGRSADLETLRAGRCYDRVRRAVGRTMLTPASSVR